MKTTKNYEVKAIRYFTGLNGIIAKRTLFFLNNNLGTGDWAESQFHEIQELARIYTEDGICLRPQDAREVAKLLKKAYIEAHPGVIMTDKAAEAWKHEYFRKLKEELGIEGLDYVLTKLQQAKYLHEQPGSEVQPQGMLAALRWNERRPDQDSDTSNEYHHKKGLGLLYFHKAEQEALHEYSFLLANAYELVVAVCHIRNTTSEPKPAKPLTIREMKVNFLMKAELIEGFYAVKAPVLPEGLAAEDISESVLALAKKGMMVNSSAILQYADDLELYKAKLEQIKAEFAPAEVELILNKREQLLTLICEEW